MKRDRLFRIGKDLPSGAERLTSARFWILSLLVVLCCRFGSGTVVWGEMRDLDGQTNHFSFAEIRAEISEPSWNPEKGIGFVPFQRIPKDPILKNTSRDQIMTIGTMKLVFAYTDRCPDPADAGKPLSSEDMERLMSFLSLDYEADAENGLWIRFPGETAADSTQCFYYSLPLTSTRDESDETRPLFTALTAKEDGTDEDYQWLRDKGGFDILVSGMVLYYQDGMDITETAVLHKETLIQSP